MVMEAENQGGPLLGFTDFALGLRIRKADSGNVAQWAELLSSKQEALG